VNQEKECARPQFPFAVYIERDNAITHRNACHQIESRPSRTGKPLHPPATKPRYSRKQLLEFGGEGLLERGAAERVWIHGIA